MPYVFQAGVSYAAVKTWNVSVDITNTDAGTDPNGFINWHVSGSGTGSTDSLYSCSPTVSGTYEIESSDNRLGGFTDDLGVTLALNNVALPTAFTCAFQSALLDTDLQNNGTWNFSVDLEPDPAGGPLTFSAQEVPVTVDGNNTVGLVSGTVTFTCATARSSRAQMRVSSLHRLPVVHG